jgi:cysteine desulfurase
MQLFLDANAHLPIHPKAMESLVKFNNSIAGHGNAMAGSRPGRESASIIEESREKITKLIGAKTSNQIIFTSTCTQACEWALEILKSRNYNKVYCSTIEHPAVSTKSTEIFGNNILFVSKDGEVNCTFNPEPNSAMVCVYINNEIGTVQKISEIQVPFFSDMSQALGKIPVNVSKIPNLKLATFGAHKFGGPVGVGILYIQDTDWWQEFGSGSRYYFDRSGTPDTGLILASAVALEEAIKTIPSRYEKAIRFSSVLDNGVEEFGLKVIAKNYNKIPHTSFIKIGKKAGPYIMSQLESDGIFIGLGSACGALHTASSPIMSALGEGGLAHDYIRISQWGNYGEEEAKYVVNALKKYTPKH